MRISAPMGPQYVYAWRYRLCSLISVPLLSRQQEEMPVQHVGESLSCPSGSLRFRNIRIFLIHTHWNKSSVLRGCGSVFRAHEQTVLHKCVWRMGVLSTLRVDFLDFLQGNRNHHLFSDDVGCHGLQLVCYCAVEDEHEDENAAGGFPRGSLRYHHPVSRSTQ